MAAAMGRLAAVGQPSHSWNNAGRWMELWTLVESSATRTLRAVTS